MPNEDKDIGGSLVFDFRKWGRPMKTIYAQCILFSMGSEALAPGKGGFGDTNSTERFHSPE